MTTSMPQAASAISAQPDARSRFLETFRRECATTKKVLRAFPAERADLKPHERSNSAQQLAFTFVIECAMAMKVLRGEPLGPAGFPTPPGTWEETLAAFDRATQEMEAHLQKASPHLEGTLQFFTGPKQMGEWTLEDFLWFLLHDQIHHRGQLTVYLRMAGGKVPSIYGPSLDEPWM
ncbi:MAG: DinB family protein [Gemmatimonadaceae bacterium]